jgi:hypothetical protein
MRMLVVYFHHPSSGIYTYYDYPGYDSWEEVIGVHEKRDQLLAQFSQGWIPKAVEQLSSPSGIPSGQLGLRERVEDLLHLHKSFDFRPVWPVKSAAIKWKEGQKITHEVWSAQDRENIDFSKITEDLCKGSVGNHHK